MKHYSIRFPFQRLYMSVVAVMIAFSIQGVYAQNNDNRIRYYNQWSKLSSKQLMEKGEYFRNVARKPDSALVCFSIVANRYYEQKNDQKDIEWSIEAMTYISYLYENEFGDFAKATSYNLRAKELAEKHHYNRFMPIILLNEANIHGLRNLYVSGDEFNPDVLDSFKRVFIVAHKQKNWYAMIISFLNMMLHTSFCNKESLIEEEMDIIKNTNIPANTTHLRYARCLIDGVRAWNNHQPDSALACYTQLLEIAKEQKDVNQKALSLLVANDYLCFWYSEMSQFDKALEKLKINEEIAIEFNLTDHLLDSYKSQSDLYRDLKKENLATEYYIKYLEGKNDIMSVRKLDNVKEAEFLYQLNQKNEEVREMAYRQNMKNRLLWIVCGFSLFLLLTLVLLIVKYRQVKERNLYLYQNSLEMIRADEEHRQLIEKQEAQLGQTTEKPKAELEQDGHRMDVVKMTDLLHRIFMVMETSEEVYSAEFSLPRLAELVGDKRNNVSEAINQQYKTNFNTLLNEYRIKEACRRMNDTENYGNYTIEYIGQGVGFKSRSTFTTVFKQIIGLTPAAYMKLAKQR